MRGTSRSDYYGNAFFYKNSRVINPKEYNIVINPDPKYPAVGLKADASSSVLNLVCEYKVENIKGKSTEVLNYCLAADNVVFFTVRDTPDENGAVLHIPDIGAARFPEGVASAILVTNDSGHISAIDTLPISLGGTGLDTVPVKDTLLGSDGKKLVSISAGNGISISNGVISSTHLSAPVFNRVVLVTPVLPPGDITIISPIVGDVMVYPISYTAKTKDTHSVFGIKIPEEMIVTVRILSAMKKAIPVPVIDLQEKDPKDKDSKEEKTSYGSAVQQFSISREEGKVYAGMFGNSSTTSPVSPYVKEFIAGDTVVFTIALDAGDRWKGNIEIVSIKG